MHKPTYTSQLHNRTEMSERSLPFLSYFGLSMNVELIPSVPPTHKICKPKTCLMTTFFHMKGCSDEISNSNHGSHTHRKIMSRG